MKKFSESKIPRLGFLGIFIFLTGLFLRLYNLSIIPVFVDEAIYIRWAQVMKAEETLRFLPLSDGKQPLFMWLIIPLLKFIGDPLVAGRLVSVLAGMASLFGIFILAFILFRSLKVSFLASFIYSILPFSVFFDRLALADSLLSSFGVYFLVFLVLTIKKVRLDAAMLSGFALGGALITKSPGLYFAILSPLSLLLAKWPNKFKEIFIKLSIYVFLLTVLFVIGFGIYNVLRLGTNFHMISIRNKDYVYPISHILTSPLDPFLPFIDRSKEYFIILGTLPLSLLFIWGAVKGFFKYKKETLLLLGWFIIPIFASSEFSKTMTARYIYFSVPYFCILSALSLFNISANNKNKNLFSFQILGKALFIIFCLISLNTDFRLLINPQTAYLPRSERSGYLEDWTSGYGIYEVSNFLKDEYKKEPDKKIVVGTEGYFGTLPDGLQIYLNESPQITVIGVGEPIRELATSLKESKAYGNKTYLVVNNTRLLVNPESVNLKLIKSFEKAKPPDREREKLLLFEVQ